MWQAPLLPLGGGFGNPFPLGPPSGRSIFKYSSFPAFTQSLFVAPGPLLVCPPSLGICGLALPPLSLPCVTLSLALAFPSSALFLALRSAPLFSVPVHASFRLHLIYSLTLPLRVCDSPPPLVPCSVPLPHLSVPLFSPLFLRLFLYPSLPCPALFPVALGPPSLPLAFCRV